jgi:Flp pilus assembly protein TadD
MARKTNKRRPPEHGPPERSKPMASGAVDRRAAVPAPHQDRWPYGLPAVCGLLLLAVALIFGKTVSYDFVNYDDDRLVCENPVVARGVTAQGVVRAVTTSVAEMWYPLTLISYMLDRQMYGPGPWGYHWTNVLLHAATTVILFLVLRRMTGNLWASALAALLFAIHPLRAEAVAWVSDRKCLLSGFFFVSTIAAYVAYARRPFSPARYLAMAGLFALGLLAMPQVVTLPLVLLLLDYWPLGRICQRRAGGAGKSSSDGGLREPAQNTDQRFQGSDSVRNPPVSQRFAPRALQLLVIEKVPLLLLAVACSVATFVSERTNIATLTSLPISARIASGLVSYAVYLGQFFWPHRLAAYYPYSENLPARQVAGACAVLVLVSVAALLSRRWQPAVLVGWLWYLGTLVPMIGLVQIASHVRADRYTYLPQIGLCIAVVWGVRWAVEGLCGHWPSRRWLFAVGSTLLATGFMACAWRQTSYWRNSETLWTHALACTAENPAAHNGLGIVLADRGQVEEAIAQYRMALEIRPGHAEAQTNLGSALADRGQADEAIAHFRKALEIKPGLAEAHNKLGSALARRGQVEEAVAQFQKALQIKPECMEAHNNLGNALASRGQVDEAIRHYQEALEIDPGYLLAHVNLGDALARRGRLDQAMAHYQEALGLASARNDTALAEAIGVRIRLLQEKFKKE